MITEISIHDKYEVLKAKLSSGTTFQKAIHWMHDTEHTCKRLTVGHMGRFGATAEEIKAVVPDITDAFIEHNINLFK